MARKKQTLRSGYDESISLIGISCHLKSYRLSFSMNQALNFQFQRIDDFEIPANSQSEKLLFPFLIYDDSEMKNHFCLISNHHPQGKLVPDLGQVDYFLMAKNPMGQGTRQVMITRIRKISQVLAAYEIDLNGNNGLDHLLEEMELHLLISTKKTKVLRA
ncbi:MAG: IPExxxVDY family protein [Bacteroidota bacterium]